MADVSLQHRNPEPAHFPVEGMETVLATVSGYHGSERFNLIRLISHTGASYVGNMNQYTTHLVCWKFEGKKYELAKKFKIVIVNHRWIEDCVKKGRRVTEEPYSFQSGEEIGPLCLDILLGISMKKAHFQASKNTKEPTIHTECEDINNAAWTDSILFDEDLFSQKRQNTCGSNRSVRNTIKKNSRKDCPVSNKYCYETLSSSTVMKLKEASTSQRAYPCGLEKRKSSSPEVQSRGQRLVKKHIRTEDCLTDDFEEAKVLPHINCSRILSDSADVDRNQSSSNGQTSDTRCFLSGQDNTDVHDDVEEIEDMNDKSQNACANGALSSLATSKEHGDASCEDFIDIIPGEGLPAASELSCVICWTDFSSTRGVLQCGHRFCFSCIQNWADHMASRRKSSTCPLCKASFICITKVEDAVSLDQKIYSQSIPLDNSKMDLYILPDETQGPPGNPLEPVCCRCSNKEPVDLLIRCHFCQIRCVHSYCLDPPLLPWTCIHCKDLQMLYLHSR